MMEKNPTRLQFIKEPISTPQGKRVSLVVITFLLLSSVGQSQVTILGTEVVQTIQDLKTDVPLVANKPTLVRVYASSTSSSSVNAELAITNQSTSATLKAGPVLLTAGAGFPAVRDDIAKSINFVLPSNWTTGSIMLTGLKVYDSQNTQLQCSGWNNKQVQFTTVPPLRVRVVGFSYQVPGTSTVAEPREIDFSAINSWLQRAYPVATVLMTQTTLDASDQGLSTGDLQSCNSVNLVLSNIRGTEMNSGTDSRTHYYGVVPDDGGFMRGCSSGMPETPDASFVASGPSGTPSASFAAWDTEGTYAGWYAGHEVAHTFGRHHPPRPTLPGFCGASIPDDATFPDGWNMYLSGASPDQYVGLDFGVSGTNPIALPGTLWTDIMTYCDYVWPSAYTYQGILARLQSENAMTQTASVTVASIGGGNRTALLQNGSARSAVQSPAQSAPTVPEMGAGGLSVIASVNLTKKTGTIRFVSRSLDNPSPAANPESRGAIRAVDDSGKILFTQIVQVREDTDVPTGKDQTALVNAIVPDTAKISKLILLLDNVQIAQMSVDSHEKQAVLSNLTTHDLKPLEAESSEIVAFIPGSADEQTKQGMLLRWSDTSDSSSYTVQIGPVDQPPETLAIAISSRHYIVKKNVLDRYRGKTVKVIVSANNLSRTQVLTKTVDIK
jgi:hypothetical protein